jgi:bis(5'-nucleosidyl)-tetraphosphatase
MIKDQSFGVIPILKEAQQIKFLLIQHQKGHWAFPKGHPEDNETSIETAQRELKEETGISEVKVLSEKEFEEKYIFRNTYGGKKGSEADLIDKSVTYFIGFVENPEITIQVKEVKDYKWLSFEEALETMTFEPGKKLLIEAHDYLESLE